MKTIDQVIADKLASFYVGDWPIGNLILCIIALLLSALFCGIIGYERERRGRTAGLRTHLLVGVGSCVIMIISIYGFPTIYADGQVLNRDVARLAAQVIAGVGFLGAGAIIHRNDGIKGLTTAATIWVVMAIGLACGSMNFILAIGVTILIFVVLTVFRTVENKISKKSLTVSIHAKKDTPIVSNVSSIAKEYNCEIKDFFFETTEAGNLEVTFKADFLGEEFAKLEFVARLEKIEGVTNVNLINAHKV